MDKIQENLIVLASKVFGIPESDLTEESSMGEPSEWDSFAQISLMVALEEQYNIVFSPIEIGESKTIQLILELIIQKLQAR
jgi:acyl carrier protein